jgi:putative membrane protein insertion efficiency factor
VIALARGYRFAVSPWLGSACRFHPSCSQYAIAVIERDGALRGGLRALWRLARCNPLGRSGLDLP